MNAEASTTPPCPLLMVHDVAREFNVTPSEIRRLVAVGRLQPCLTTVSGVRLFDAETVARLAVERRARTREALTRG